MTICRDICSLFVLKASISPDDILNDHILNIKTKLFRISNLLSLNLNTFSEKITWQKVALSTNKQLQKKYKISEFDCRHLRCALESCVTMPKLRSGKPLANDSIGL